MRPEGGGRGLTEDQLLDDSICRYCEILLLIPVVCVVCLCCVVCCVSVCRVSLQGPSGTAASSCVSV